MGKDRERGRDWGTERGRDMRPHFKLAHTPTQKRTHTVTQICVLYLKPHHKVEQCRHKAHKYKYVCIMQYNKRQKQHIEEKERSQRACAQGYTLAAK